jgi:hypothetical protein
MVSLSDIAEGPKLFETTFGPKWGPRWWRVFFVVVILAIATVCLTDIGKFGKSATQEFTQEFNALIAWASKPKPPIQAPLPESSANKTVPAVATAPSLAPVVSKQTIDGPNPAPVQPSPPVYDDDELIPGNNIRPISPAPPPPAKVSTPVAPAKVPARDTLPNDGLPLPPAPPSPAKVSTPVAPAKVPARDTQQPPQAKASTPAPAAPADDPVFNSYFDTTIDNGLDYNPAKAPPPTK